MAASSCGCPALQFAGWRSASDPICDVDGFREELNPSYASMHYASMQGVRALDWQLSTLGDPMADFTYLLMQWTMPGLAGADLKALNIPSMEEAAQIYCNVTGSAVPDLNWYFAYNLFRLAGITQGIAGRVRDGTAANVKAMESAKRTVPLSQASWEYAQKAGAK